jgi:fatty acid desaturase
MSKKSLVSGPEWPTLALIAAVYALWIAVTIHASALTPWIATPLVALALTLHSSLQHEVIHGHPLPSRRLSAALVYPPLGLAIPYPRFRDQHLAHHRDADLTDPYDDPESNYLDPAVWERLPGWVRRVLLFNNTLLGRMTVGPAVGMAAFLRDEARAARAGDRAVWRAWGLHALGLVRLGCGIPCAGSWQGGECGARVLAPAKA